MNRILSKIFSTCDCQNQVKRTCGECIHFNACCGFDWAMTENSDATKCANFFNRYVDAEVYDQYEEHHNCTVRIFRNSATGKISVSWWEGDDNGKGNQS